MTLCLPQQPVEVSRANLASFLSRPSSPFSSREGLTTTRTLFFGLGRRIAHISAVTFEARDICPGTEVEALVGSLVPCRHQCYRKY